MDQYALLNEMYALIPSVNADGTDLIPKTTSRPTKGHQAMIRTLALGCLLLVLLPNLCQAQLPGQLPAPEPSPARIDPEIEKKALDLIEALSDQVSNLHSPSNRMRAQCSVADLLWSRDEKRARALFSAAVAQMIARIAEIDYSDPEIYQEMNRIYQSRQELILRIASHDADLALSALQKTRPQTNPANPRANMDFQNEAN